MNEILKNLINEAATLVSLNSLVNSDQLDQENDLILEATHQLATFNHGLNLLALEEEGRQLSSSNGTIGQLINRIPCSCKKGVCRCCGGFLSLIGMNPCAEVLYRPEEFSFELKMRVNDMVWFRRKVSGQNPPPLCFRPPRFSFVRACLQFHDIWFLGRNMHVCMYITGSFQGFNIFEREFDCLMFGDKGIKIVKPEDGYPVRPDDIEIDESGDEFEDYDENVVR